MLKLRVMHVMEATIGGTRRYLEEVLPALMENGIDVELVVSAKRDASFREVISRFQTLGIKVIEIDMARSIRPLSDLCAMLKLRHVIATSNANIYHFHSSKAGALGRLAATLAGKRNRIYTPHAYAFLDDSRHIAAHFYQFVERILGFFTDHIIAVSNSERLITLSNSLARIDQVSVVPNGIGTLPEHC